MKGKEKVERRGKGQKGKGESGREKEKRGGKNLQILLVLHCFEHRGIGAKNELLLP